MRLPQVGLASKLYGKIERALSKTGRRAEVTVFRTFLPPKEFNCTHKNLFACHCKTCQAKPARFGCCNLRIDGSRKSVFAIINSMSGNRLSNALLTKTM